MFADLYVMVAFMAFLMLLFVGFSVYVMRMFLSTFLGTSKQALPESAETDFNPVSSGGPGVEEYLDRLGGDRFTSPATFAMNRSSIAETPAPSDIPDGLEETDPSEIAIV